MTDQLQITTPAVARMVAEALIDAQGAQYVAHVAHDEHQLARKAVEAATHASLMLTWMEASGAIYIETRGAYLAAATELTTTAHRLADKSRASRLTRLATERTLAELTTMASL